MDWRQLVYVGSLAMVCAAPPLWAQSVSATSPVPPLTEPLVVCSEIPPYAFADQGRYRGYAYELGQEVMRRLGYHGTIEVQPLARATRTVQTQPQVIALWVGRIPEREHTMRWLFPVMHDDFSIYTLQGRHPKVETLAQAKQLGTLGVNIGAANAIAAMRQGLGRIEMISSNDANGRKLLVDHIQGWITTDATVDFFTRQHGLPADALVKGITLTDFQAWVAASPHLDAAVVAQWQTALAAMSQDGTLQQLAERYHIHR